MQVRDVLDLFPEMQLRAGADGLDRPLRWVHVVDQPDMASWLREGTFVLTTGIGWREGEDAQRAAIAQIARAGAVGLLIAVGRFLPGIPQCAAEEAHRQGMPLVEAPFSLPFIDITDQVQRMLIGEQYQVLEQADRIHRALTASALEAGDLTQIASRLVQLLDCDAAVYSVGARGTRPTLLTRVGRVPQGPAVERMLRRAGDLVEPMRDQADGRDALYVPVRGAQGQRALLALFAREKDFGVLARTVAEHAASVIALHLAHQRELAEMERRVHASYVDALLTGAYEAGDLAAAERARLRGLDPEGDFRVVIARVGEGLALSTREEFAVRQDLLAAVEARLASLSQTAATTYSLNRVLIVWPSGPRDREHLRRLRDDVARHLGQDVLLAASAPVQGLGAVQRASWEAERLLSVAMGDAQLLLYEDQVLLRLLGRNDPLTRRELRAAVVGELCKERQGEALVDTLEALVACGYHQLEAAKRLGVHRNTMQKRIGRIEAILGRSLLDPETQTLIYLSLAVARLKD